MEGGRDEKVDAWWMMGKQVADWLASTSGEGGFLAWGKAAGLGSPPIPHGGQSFQPLSHQEGICRQTLLGPAFAQCHRLVDAEVYVATCTQDLCRCPTCPCATFAEYSRQCAHAGGQPQSWRGSDLCRECPHALGRSPRPCTHTGSLGRM